MESRKVSAEKVVNKVVWGLAAECCLKPDLARKRRFLVLFGILSVFLILFRSSGAIFVGLAAVGGLCILKGRNRIKVLVCAAISILVGMGALTGLNNGLQATKDRENELLCIPHRNLGR